MCVRNSDLVRRASSGDPNEVRERSYMYDKLYEVTKRTAEVRPGSMPMPRLHVDSNSRARTSGAVVYLALQQLSVLSKAELFFPQVRKLRRRGWPLESWPAKNGRQTRLRRHRHCRRFSVVGRIYLFYCLSVRTLFSPNGKQGRNLRLA